MRYGTNRTCAAVVLLVGALAATGAALLAQRDAAAQPPAAKGKGPADAGVPAKAEDPAPFEVRGKVVGPDGKPVAGTEVFVCDRWAMGKDLPKDKGAKSLPVRTTTDAAGVYTFKTTETEMDRNPSVVALAEGLGPDWVPLTRANRGGGLPDLRLVKDDVPVTGRVVDLESQPVAGAIVCVLRVLKAPGENLWPFFGQWSYEHPAGDSKFKARPVGYELGAMTSLDVACEMKTGADGRFKLSGFGRDRLVLLAIEGPDLGRRVIEVVTRPTLPMGVPIFAAKFDCLLAPAKPIEGTARDKATGKPAAGVEVICFAGVDTFELVRATTDSEGRFKLTGVPKSKGYGLAVQGGPFFTGVVGLEDTPGLKALSADVELERGLEVRGRLVDKATGRPVRGFVSYHARVENPHLKDFPSFTRAIGVVEVQTGRDGAFSLAVLPGKGLITARSWENRFTNAWSSPDLSAVTLSTPDAGRKAVRVKPSVESPEAYHAAVAIDASDKDPKSLLCEIALDPGRTLTGTVVGPDGKPLTDVLAWGLAPAHDTRYDGDLRVKQLRTPTFTALGLDDRNPRYLLFWHKEKGLAKALLVWGDELGALTVRLEPFGTLTGRVVDQDGKPLAGVEVRAPHIGNLSSHEARLFLGGLVLPNDVFAELLFETSVAKTNAEGRFSVSRLVPGLVYDLPGWIRDGERDQVFRNFAKAVPAPTGAEPKDLGTVTITLKKPEAKKP